LLGLLIVSPYLIAEVSDNNPQSEQGWQGGDTNDVPRAAGAQRKGRGARGDAGSNADGGSESKGAGRAKDEQKFPKGSIEALQNRGVKTLTMLGSMVSKQGAANADQASQLQPLSDDILALKQKFTDLVVAVPVPQVSSLADASASTE